MNPILKKLDEIKNNSIITTTINVGDYKASDYLWDIQPWEDHDLFPIYYISNLSIDDFVIKDTKMSKEKTRSLWLLYNKYYSGISAQVWFENNETMLEYMLESTIFLKENLSSFKSVYGFSQDWDREEEMHQDFESQRMLFMEYQQSKGGFADLFVDTYLRKNGRWKYWQEKMSQKHGPFKDWKTGNEPMYLEAWRSTKFAKDNTTINEEIQSSIEAATNDNKTLTKAVLDFYQNNK
jgi:hypothetical protein